MSLKKMIMIGIDIQNHDYVSHVGQEMLALREHLISPFKAGFISFLYHQLILPMSGQVLYRSTILILELWYGLILLLTNLLELGSGNNLIMWTEVYQ